MPTAVETSYVFAKLDELEPAARLAPGATDDGRKRFDVRRNLDITAFGVSAFSAPSGVTVINEHDETLLGEAGQEELYIVLNGAATFEIDGETVEAPTEPLVEVDIVPAKRRHVAEALPGARLRMEQGVRARPRGSRGGIRRVQRRRLRGGALEAAHRRREAAGQSRGALQRRVLRGASWTR